MKKIIVVGYGSIGKRHVSNLLKLGIRPIVVTKYPDSNDIHFTDSISKCGEVDYAIIATPTGRHLDDFKRLNDIKCKNILIEKPVELSYRKASELNNISVDNNINAYVAYNLRFLNVFKKVKDFISSITNSARIVNIIAGQYLPEWRTGSDYTQSYSADRGKGGGVDLDLSHEIDYMLWLFGVPSSVEFAATYHVSSLNIKSPDLFKAIYNYDNYIIDVTTDYIRSKERSIRVLGENVELLFIDFINKTGRILGEPIIDTADFNIEDTYVRELEEFLNSENRDILSSLESGLKVIELLGMEA